MCIIFNPNNHVNIITKNEKYIDVDIDLLLKHKYIFIKSPTGTGKTVIFSIALVDNIIANNKDVIILTKKKSNRKLHLNLICK